jgi:DNA repair protein RecN (Recombination protein N)
MLTCLRVRSFAIIDELEVELESGLNVVTGETGAGKSILVDALELVLGARARPEVVRTGAEHAEVEALIDVSGNPELRARVDAAGITSDDGAGELCIRRVVKPTGRGRAYVNGRLATAGQLAELAAGLVDISSQHEHHTLADPSRHLDYLDAFGRLEPLRAEVAKAWAALREAADAVGALDRRVRDRGEREDLLRFQIGEIDALGPSPGEDAELAAERERLRHAERLATAAGGAEEAISAQDGAICEHLARLAAELADAARVDAALEPLVAQVDGARAQLEDAARELGAYARAVTLDPDRLADVDERLDAMKKLVRKYGGSVAAVLEHRERAAAELEELDRHEERAEELRRVHAAALGRARDAARELSDRRRDAAKKLGKAISAELASLGMGDAKVHVEVESIEGREGELVVDGARLSATGIDRVEFLIAPNRGEEARPLRKIASGGELSRSMLAIKRVLAGLRPSGLYVFDEVDAGVGGAVAEVIGRKLRDVSRHHQVLCITHLPQIAVFADAHFQVVKEVASGRTKSAVRRLVDADRLEEVARMLGGLKITPKTRAAAAEMLHQAQGRT